MSISVNQISPQNPPIYMSQVQSLREVPAETASLVGDRQRLESKLVAHRNRFNFLSQLQETFAPIGRFFNRLSSPSSPIVSGIGF